MVREPVAAGSRQPVSQSETETELRKLWTALGAAPSRIPPERARTGADSGARALTTAFLCAVAGAIGSKAARG
jgi:hypothetical protein